MRTTPMRFRFKGERDYIHGPDIYNEMMEQIEAHYSRSTLGKLRLAMHTFASKQCNMIIGEIDEIPLKPERAVSELKIDTTRGRLVTRLVETDYSIDGRYEFDESHIENWSSINGENIVITGDSGYSAIEVAVSLTKQLHNRLFPSNDAKWIVSVVELERPLERADSSGMVVQFKHNFSNRLTKSEMFSGDVSLGHIYFSLVQR